MRQKKQSRTNVGQERLAIAGEEFRMCIEFIKADVKQIFIFYGLIFGPDEVNLVLSGTRVRRADLFDRNFYNIFDKLNKCNRLFAENGAGLVDLVDQDELELLVLFLKTYRPRDDYKEDLPNNFSFKYEAALNDFLFYVEHGQKDVTGNEIKDGEKKAGAHKHNFDECIISRKFDSPQKIAYFIEKMEEEMEGKRGKDAARVIAAAMDLGYIRQPTFAEVVDKFGGVIGKNTYPLYFPKNKDERDKDIFEHDSLEGIKDLLKV